jgi:hypothetical protein
MFADEKERRREGNIELLETRLNVETHFKNGNTVSLKIMTMQTREMLLAIREI